MAEELKIWIIYQFASTPELPGSKRSYQYAKSFADMGNDVTLWTSSFNHWGKVEAIEDDSSFIAKQDGRLKVLMLKTRPLYRRNDSKRVFNLLNFARVFSKKAKRMPDKPDVIIASYPSPFAAFVACRFARKNNIKFILEVRDLWPQVWVERGAFPKYHPFVVLLYALERYLYKNAHVICTALPFVSDYLRRKKIKRQGIFWIPNAVDLRALQTENRDGSSDICLSMQSQQQRGKLNVAYVGGLGPANRVDCILQAARILKEKGENGVHFTIVGEGHARSQLSEYISSNNLDAVTLWPAVPAHEVFSILQQADIGVLCLHDNPIYKYGINLHKLYDYMAAGLPIVFSANVRNNLVDSGHAGITVPPGDAGAIASALLKLKRSTEQQRAEMGMSGHRYVSENYALEVLSKKYFEIISNQGGVVSDVRGE